MELQAPPIYIVVPGRVYRRDSDATHTPMFHQVEGLAVDEDITLADLARRRCSSSRARCSAREREVRLRAGYFPFTEPSVEVDVSCFDCGGTGYLRDGSRCPLCKGSGWIEILGAGMVDPNVLGFVARQRLRPRARAGLRVRHGHRADRDAASTACPTCACSSRTTCACWSSSADEGPRRLAARVLRPRPLTAARSASGWRSAGTELERIDRVGRRARHRRLRRSAGCSSAEQHPDADRLTRLRGGRRLGQRRARSSAARPTWPPARRWPVALPGAVMPDGTKLGEAKLRGVESERDDPGGGRGRASATDHAGIMVLPDDAARRATPLEATLPIARRGARARGQPEPARLPRGLRRRARAARADRGAARARPRREDATAGPATGAEDHASVEIDPEICLRFSVRVFEDVKIGPVAAVAEGAPDGGRPAPDQQRRRHHQLRDAR